jgi:hypothetical protein
VTAALPSIRQAVAQGYRDLARSFASLFPLVAIAFLIISANGLLQYALRLDDGTERSRLLVSFLLGAAQQFLLMPYYLAVHRLIILDEVTHSYRFAPRELGFQRFYWLSIAFDFLLLLPTLVASLLGTARFRYQIAVSAITLIFCIGVFLRLIIVFPAFAVDAPGASLKNAYEDTRGQSWRILGIIFVANLPFLLPLLAMTMLLVGDRESAQRVGFLVEIISSAFGIILVTLLIVIASRLYMSIGSRLKDAV